MKKKHGITKRELMGKIRKKYSSPYDEAFTIMSLENYFEWITGSTRGYHRNKKKANFFEENKTRLVEETHKTLKKIPKEELHHHKPSLWIKTIIWMIYSKLDEDHMGIERFSRCFDISRVSIRNCAKTLERIL